MSAGPSGAPITAAALERFKNEFNSDRKNQLAQNLVAKTCPHEAALSRKAVERTIHVYNRKVEETKPVTNQKSTGRCWLFACLNAMRIAFNKSKTLEDFEFSQGYLFFWDKVERCNYFLNAVVEVARREPRETPDGRLMSFLLKDPTCDGGQWDMVVNLVEKYGVMPKKCFPETYSSENSLRMNRLLKSKLREYSYALNKMIDEGASDDDLRAKIESQMSVIFRIIGICLGVPPETFTWQYYDKAKKYNDVREVTPLQFYTQHVKPVFDISNKICLVSDPRPQNPYGKLYSVEFLGNVVGGKKTVYNNQPIEELMKATAESISRNESVWFGCDVTKNFATKPGLADTKAHDYELLYGTSVNEVLSKADRLIYGESEMTHAMVITGVQTDDDGNPVKWRVENSWGDDRHEKGYLMMTSDWFKEYVFEVVVDKAIVPGEVMEAFGEDVKTLPAWDPMGALASSYVE